MDRGKSDSPEEDGLPGGCRGVGGDGPAKPAADAVDERFMQGSRVLVHVDLGDFRGKDKDVRIPARQAAATLLLQHDLHTRERQFQVDALSRGDQINHHTILLLHRDDTPVSLNRSISG